MTSRELILSKRLFRFAPYYVFISFSVGTWFKITKRSWNACGVNPLRIWRGSGLRRRPFWPEWDRLGTEFWFRRISARTSSFPTTVRGRSRRRIRSATTHELDRTWSHCHGQILEYVAALLCYAEIKHCDWMFLVMWVHLMCLSALIQHIVAMLHILKFVLT